MSSLTKRLARAGAEKELFTNLREAQTVRLLVFSILQTPAQPKNLGFLSIASKEVAKEL
jgi:hypothetical protein